MNPAFMEASIMPPAAAPRRKTREKVFDFKLHFHASRVPTASWDKLVVSLISFETGKTTVKTSRGQVRNGSCHWPDAVIESAKISRDPSTGEYAEKLYKVIVQMGSLRVGILGDATINLSDYVNAKAPDTLTLQLRNCKAGTILHVKIQCLTRNTRSREFYHQSGTSLDQDDSFFFSDDDDTSSEFSENLTEISLDTSMSQPLRYRYSQGQTKTTTAGPPPNRFRGDAPSSITNSRHSSDSLDSLTRGNALVNGSGNRFANTEPVSSSSSARSLPRRSNSNFNASRDSNNNQESIRSSYTKNEVKAGANPSIPWQDSSNRRMERTNLIMGPSPPENGTEVLSSLTQKLVAAQTTIQELRQECSMLERQARRLGVQVETLKQQVGTQLKNGAECRIEMSALEAERDNLKFEVEKLKADKLASKKWENREDNTRLEIEDFKRLIRGLQDELDYEKGINTSLHLQLCKTQESHADLVSGLAELEGTIELKIKEIHRLADANERLKEQSGKTQDSTPAAIKLDDSILQRTDRFAETDNSQEASPVFDEIYQTQTVDQGEADWRQKVVEWQQKCIVGEAQFMRSMEEKDREIKLLESKLLRLEAESKEQRLSNVNREHMRKLMEKDESMKEHIKNVVHAEDGANNNGLANQIVENNSGEDMMNATERLKWRREEHLFHNLSGKDVESDEELIPIFGTARTSEHLSGNQVSDPFSKRDVGITDFHEKEVFYSTNDKMLEAELAVRCGKIEKLIEHLANQIVRERKLEAQVIKNDNEGVLSESELEGLVEERGISKSLRKKNFEQPMLLGKIKLLNAFENDGISVASMLEMEMTDMQDKAPNGMLVTIETFDKLVDQLAALSTTLDSQLVAKRTLVRRASELKLHKEDLQTRVFELEEENLHLSEKLSSLKGQLILMTESRNFEMDVVSGLDQKLIRLEEHASQEAGNHLQIRQNLEWDVDEEQHDVSSLRHSHNEHEKAVAEFLLHPSIVEQQLQDALNESLLLPSNCSALEADITYHRALADKKEIDSLADSTVTQMHVDKNQEAVSDLHQQLAKLEQRWALASQEAENHFHLSQKLEQELCEQEDEVSKLRNSHSEHEKAVVELSSCRSLLEQQLHETESKYISLKENCTALEAEIEHQQREGEQREFTMKAEIQSLISIRDNLQHHANRLEETLTRMQAEKVSTIDSLQSELQRLAEELSSTLEEKEKLASQAQIEASKLCAEKLQIEESFRHMQEKVLKMEEAISLQKSLEFKIETMYIELDASKDLRSDLSHRLQTTQVLLEQMSDAETANKLKIQKLEGDLLESQVRLQEASELRAEKMHLEDSLRHMQSKVQTMEESTLMQKVLESRIENMSSEVDALRKLHTDLTHRLQETQISLRQMASAAADDKLVKLEGLLLESEAAFHKVVSEHHLQLHELEQHHTFALQEAENHFQIRQSLEQQLEQQKDEISTLRKSYEELETALADNLVHQSLLEQQLQESVSKCISLAENCTALESDKKQRQREAEQRELTFKVEIESLISIKDELQQLAKNADETLTQMQAEKVAAEEHMQRELQSLSEQMSTAIEEREMLASRALIESSQLCAEKMELEESLKHMQEKVLKMEKESTFMQMMLESKIESMASEADASSKLHKDLTIRSEHTQGLLEQMATAAVDDKHNIQKLETLLLESEHERQLLLKEQSLLKDEASELIDLTTEMQNMRERLDQTSSEKLAVQSSLENMRAHCESLQHEKMVIAEQLTALELNLKEREEELDACKRQFTETEADLYDKIEHLELSHEQLAAGLVDTGVDQLEKELIRLQSQNSLLARREQELMSTMRTYGVLQREFIRLQETNDILEARLSKIIEAAEDPSLLEKLVNLETELAEATEANNMYKMQLRSVLDKQQNVRMVAALQELGDLDQVISDLFEYKKKAAKLEGELHNMHERYSLVSLQLAEAESERGELVMTVKKLKSIKRI